VFGEAAHFSGRCLVSRRSLASALHILPISAVVNSLSNRQFRHCRATLSSPDIGPAQCLYRSDASGIALPHPACGSSCRAPKPDSGGECLCLWTAATAVTPVTKAGSSNAFPGHRLPDNPGHVGRRWRSADDYEPVSRSTH